MHNELDNGLKKKVVKMYSPYKSGRGSEIVKIIRLVNIIGALEGFTNIGYAESFFEYWLLEPGISSKKLTKTLLNLASRTGIDRILVVGCGRGGELLLLNEITNAEIIGIDISTSNINYAKKSIDEAKKEHEIKVIKGYAEDLPFDKRSFDCVYSCEAAFHFTDKSKFIDEAYRVLDKEGNFLIADIVKEGSSFPDKQNILDEYKKMLNVKKLFSEEDYVRSIKNRFDKDPMIMDITDKNIKYIAAGSNLLIRLFDIVDKLPALKKLIEGYLEKKDIDIEKFLENCKYTNLTYEHSAVRYIIINCFK